jgi:hypothetical protein
VEGQQRVGVIRDTSHERGVEGVHRQIAGPIHEISGRIPRVALLVVDLGVLDDTDAAVDASHDAHLLRGVDLADHLARHLRTREGVETQEERIGERHQRIVDLVVEDGVDAARRHVVEGTGVEQGRDGPAVSVGVLEDPVWPLEHEPAVEVQARHHALAEEEDVLGRQPVAVRSREALARCSIRGGARHDVPGHRASAAGPQVGELLGLLGKEAAVADRPDREEALGSPVAQAGPGALRVAAVLGQGFDRERLELEVPGVGFPEGSVGAQQGGQVDTGRLTGQPLAAGVVESVPELEHMTLAVGIIVVTNLLKIGRIGAIASHLAPLGCVGGSL